MLYSGAELIKNADRFERARPTERVKAIQQPEENRSALDGDAQNALLRFTRFINKEGKGRRPPSKPVKRSASGLPEAYDVQIRVTSNAQQSGELIDIYV